MNHGVGQSPGADLASGMTAEIHDSRYSWFRLGVTLLIATVGNVGMWAIIVIMPAVQAEFGIDRGGASMPYALTMIGFALGNLLIGRAVDRFGVTVALIGASLTISAGFALAAASPSVAVLAVLQLLIGLGTAASFGPLIADISHWFLRRRGIAVAIAASGNYLSGAIWPMLMAGILADHGWRAVYRRTGGRGAGGDDPGGAAAAPPPAGRGEPAPADARARARAGAVVFSPRVLMWMLALAGVGCCVAMSMPQVHIVAFCVDLGFGPAVGAEMLSLMLVGGVVSRLISGAAGGPARRREHAADRLDPAMHRRCCSTCRSTGWSRFTSSA